MPAQIVKIVGGQNAQRSTFDQARAELEMRQKRSPFRSPLEALRYSRTVCIQSSTTSPTRPANCKKKASAPGTLSHLRGRKLPGAEAVKGERKLVKDEKEENFHWIERRYGSCGRSFTLPSTVETESAQASYENGVLAITLPTKEAAKPKQVPIQIGSGSSSKPGPKQMEGSRAA